MKKKIAKTCLMLFFSLLPMTLFSSCDSDTNSYLDVIILDETSHNPVSGVTVELYQRNCDPSDYNYQVGTTNADGVFSTYYGAPAILKVRATLNLADGGYRRSEGTVRLLEGKTKTAEIILDSKVRY